jgi:hypothetical protein
MTRMTPPWKLLAAAGAVALAVWVGPERAGAEDKPATKAAPTATWNQGRVTKIAQDLADATDELRVALRAEPIPETPVTQRDHYELREEVRLLHNSAHHLADMLDSGAGRDETMPIVKRIGLLRREAEENGRRVDIQSSTFEKVTAVGGLLIQLAPYYPEGVIAGTPQ